MKPKELTKWNERHFQICLALISRPNFNPYGNSTPVNFGDIINKADRIISLLQERQAQQPHATDHIVPQAPHSQPSPNSVK